MYDSNPWIKGEEIHYGFTQGLTHQPIWNMFAENKCILVKTAEQLHIEKEQQDKTTNK